MQPNGRRALIVVDYQNDFVTGSMGFAKALTLERPIVEKIHAAKQQGVEVLFTLDKHPPATGKAGENQPPMHCVENTEGCALYGAVARCLDGTTPAFEKQTFGSLKLAKYLEEKQFAKMEFVGVSTHLCVLSNAILAQAACPNARICIDARCVASPTESDQKRALWPCRRCTWRCLPQRSGTGEQTRPKH